MALSRAFVFFVIYGVVDAALQADRDDLSPGDASVVAPSSLLQYRSAAGRFESPGHSSSSSSSFWTPSPSRCGIATTLNHCKQDLEYLKSLDRSVAFDCMGYGGAADPCTLNINNDGPEKGLNKDPKKCTGGVLFLWDEPYTQKKNAEWAAGQWKSYVQKWASQLKEQKKAGMKVTSPFFTGGDTKLHLKKFFDHCDVCNNKDSPGYIDVIVWNAWLGDWTDDKDGQVKWIKDHSTDFHNSFGERPVWLGNFGYLGAKTADKQIWAIENSGIWDKPGGIEKVYWFVGKDYGGNTENNYLKDKPGGLSASMGSRTIGKALVEKCRSLPAV